MVISSGVFKVPAYTSYNKVLRSHASSPRIGACGDESRCHRSRISLLEFGYERFEVGSAMRLASCFRLLELWWGNFNSSMDRDRSIRGARSSVVVSVEPRLGGTG